MTKFSLNTLHSRHSEEHGIEIVNEMAKELISMNEAHHLDHLVLGALASNFSEWKLDDHPLPVSATLFSFFN